MNTIRRRMPGAAVLLALVVGLRGAPATAAPPSAPPSQQQVPAAAPTAPRLEFLHLVAHWHGYASDQYLPFLEEARPEIAQVGFYGGHFWSLSHTPAGAGYPAHFPVVGLRECGDWFENLNRQIHQRHIRVVGHMNVKFLVGDPDSPEGPRGFFKFYRELWDEKELGPRPVADPLQLLERDAQGAPITNSNYSIGGMKEYWGCLLNPHWRSVLKAWTRRGIQRGVDGYMINYFYRHNCLCEHCQKAFREYLAERFTAEQLQQQLGIANLAEHRFDEIVAWHDPKESTPLRREMLRFSQIANKRAFDEVFVQYGRTLKKDLVVGQWNHMGNFAAISGDERCLLPAEQWGKDEDYLWYSTGGSAYFTDLRQGFLGEGTLQARFIRGAFDDKPFTLGKYEGTRIRAAIAELIANGGAPMGFYTRFEDPLARQEIVRYYRFISRHAEVYRANRPHGEVVLAFPRRAIHDGDLRPLESFRQLGQELLNRKVLFDVVPDDLLDEAAAKRYRLVVRPGTEPTLPQLPAELSSFQLPRFVRVSASRPQSGDWLDVHFVNYNRQEPDTPRSPGGGIADEKPIACSGGRMDVVVPSAARVTSAQFFTPEEPDARAVDITLEGGRVEAEIPQFLVYGLLRLKLDTAGSR